MNPIELISGLQHIGIPTEHLSDTIAFYQKLGFSIAHDTVNPANQAHVCFLRLGNLTIETYEGDPVTPVSGAINHIALDVSDLEAVYDYICQEGLNSTNDTIHFLPFWEHGVRYFTIEGPNKERVEFSQYCEG